MFDENAFDEYLSNSYLSVSAGSPVHRNITGENSETGEPELDELDYGNPSTVEPKRVIAWVRANLPEEFEQALASSQQRQGLFYGHVLAQCHQLYGDYFTLIEDEKANLIAQERLSRARQASEVSVHGRELPKAQLKLTTSVPTHDQSHDYRGLKPILLSEVWDKYINFRNRAKRSWSEASLTEHLGCKNVVCDLLGDPLAHTLTNNQVSNLQEDLQSLPTSASVRFPNTPRRELVLQVKSGALETKTIGDSTVNKHLRCLSQVLAWAIKHGYSYGTNPASEIRVESTGKVARSRPQLPFTESDLNKIFT
jgi:hypothetical protein